MKKEKRRIAVLLLLLCLLAAVCSSIYISYKKKEGKAAVDAIWVTQMDSGKIEAFSFISEGKVLSFTKEEDGWVDGNNESLKLEFSVVKGILDAAANLKAEEKIVEYGELSEYGLESPKNGIVLVREEEMVTLQFGGKNEIIGGYYLKRKDDNAIYLVEDEVFESLSGSLAALLISKGLL